MSHFLAVGLLALDCVTRVWRIQLATWAAGGALSFTDALRLNLYGEAASTLTPNRLGGEPARFLGMTWSGVRPVTALVALGVEVAAEWPVFGLIVLALGVHYLPDWSERASRWLGHSLARDLLTIELVALVALLVIYGLQRLVRAGAIRHRVRRQWRVAIAHVRRAPWWVVVAGALLTFVSLAARALILPALAWGLPGAPPPPPPPPPRSVRCSSARWCCCKQAWWCPSPRAAAASRSHFCRGSRDTSRRAKT